MRPASLTSLGHVASSRRRWPMPMHQAVAFALCGISACCSWVGLVCSMLGLSEGRGSDFNGRLSPWRGHNGDWLGMWRAVCGMMGAECFVSAAVLYVCRARCGLHREAWRPVSLQLCVCMLWAYVDGRGKAQGGHARDYSSLPSVSHLSASSRQPRTGGMPWAHTLMSLCAHCSTFSSTHIKCML